MNNINRSENKIYRSRKGMILGVCRGLAESFDLSVFWVRFAVFLVFFFTGFWPVTGLYILAALIMKPEPALDFQTNGEEAFYSNLTENRRVAVGRLQDLHGRVEKRLRNLESLVTSPEFKWKSRLRDKK